LVPSRRRGLTSLAVSLLLLAAVFFFVLPGLVERFFNRTLQKPPYVASPRAQDLFRGLVVADLHADSLLWGRDLLARGHRGHVDVPRLIEGGVAIQAFTVVTKTPRGLNIDTNADRSDNVTLLALAQGWPPKTWFSLKERAAYQARRLHRTAELSGGRLTLLWTARDLEAYLERRRRDPRITAAFLGIEGGQALEGDADSVETLFRAGYRMVGLAHFFDNELAGSAHGLTKGGLTEAGQRAVRRLEARRMLVDLAHASARTIDDVLAVATRPVVVSHTGVRGTCDNARNLSDQQLQRIAATGGLVGIGYWETAVCGQDARAIARAIAHAAAVAGIDHVALGSDFDGAVHVPFDTTGLPLLVDALLEAGLGPDEIARVMGGNVVRLLGASLPDVR
jgi:microsomal dipeptidase-like Zn-dependent dipeptidase